MQIGGDYVPVQWYHRIRDFRPMGDWWNHVKSYAFFRETLAPPRGSCHVDRRRRQLPEVPRRAPADKLSAGETVLAAGSRTDQLLILRKGNVAILKDGIEIARVTEPGAVF